MGLSAPKRKAKLIGSASTRNAAWTDDASLPGQRLLASMGWSQGKGLGTSSQGTAAPITVAFKMDNKGIGARRHEREARANGKADAWIGGGGELGDLFERLNRASSSTSTPVPEDSAVEADVPRATKASKEERAARKMRKKADKELKKGKKSAKGKEKIDAIEEEAHPVRVEKAVEKVAAALPHRLVSRARYLRAKRMVGTDQASVNEILGIASSSGTASPALQNASPMIASPAPEIHSTPQPAPTKDKSSKRKREDCEKAQEKEEKRARKEARRLAKQSKSEDVKDELDASAIESATDPSFAAGGGMKVSTLSVQDYLQGQLMKRRAALIRQKRGEDASLWSRAASVQV